MKMLNKQGKQNACDTGEAGNDKVVLSLLLAINDRLSLLPVILGLLVGNIIAKIIDALFFSFIACSSKIAHSATTRSARRRSPCR